MDCCIYENGKIFTSDRENLYADAMLVTDGIIRRVGCAADIENMAPKGCRRAQSHSRLCRRTYASFDAGRLQQTDFGAAAKSKFY